MIVDTTFILDLLDGESGSLDKIKELERNNQRILFTTVSVFELWQGVEDIKNDKKRETILNFLASFDHFILSIESAKMAGSIHASLIRRGLKINPEDSMIAGIALAENEILLTRNVKHFKRIEGLKVESY